MFSTRIGYFGDFFVYPVLIAALLVGGIMWNPDAVLRWVAIFVGCLVLWTFLEYVLHRFAFHHMPFLREAHDLHHHAERDLVGTPTWLSLVAHAAFGFGPILLLTNFVDASAASAGLMLGYLWYVSVHHVVHHWHPAHSGYLYSLKRRHALHHHHDQERNFGVTTGFWDRVFGTDDRD